MKQLLVLLLVGALIVAGGSRAVASDTGDQFLEAYFAIQQAYAAEQAGNLARAEAKFTSAVATLNEIKAAAPDWNPRTVEYRLTYCANHLARLRTQRGAAPATVAPEAGDADQIRRLTEELAQARQQIRQLEADREQLTAKLQQTPAPAESVQELLKQNRELSVQLAARQAELTEARQQATAGAAPGRGTDGSVSQDLVKARADLEQVRQLLTSTQTDLQQSRAENTKLRVSYDQVVTQLTDANRKLDAAVAAGQKDAEIITQLRKENAMHRVVTDRPAVTAAPPATPTKKWWWPFGPEEAKKETPQAEPAVKMQTTETGKLVAELQSPAPASSETPKTDVKKLVTEGRAALDKGDLDRAETTMQETVRLAPDDSAAKSLLGVIYFRRGKLDDAFGELTRAIALDPRNAEAHNYLGITLTEKGWSAAAETEIQRAIELNPKYADAHFNLAVIYARAKTPRLDQARHHYEKSLSCGGGRDPQLEALIEWKK